jgi:aryl-alcohol dehydrogenase-like predicted oxidoreductase
MAFGFLNHLPQMTGSQAALAYVLANPAIACAVVGTTRPAHLAENLAASGMTLPASVTAAIHDRQVARLSG